MAGLTAFDPKAEKGSAAETRPRGLLQRSSLLCPKRSQRLSREFDLSQAVKQYRYLEEASQLARPVRSPPSLQCRSR